jgi:hypothetical protein
MREFIFLQHLIRKDKMATVDAFTLLSLLGTSIAF